MKLFPLALGLVLASCASTHNKPSIFGEPLYVNGKRVSDDEIKLALIYGSGRTRLDSLTTNLIIDDEIARQARELAAREADPAAAQRRIADELHAKCSVSDAEFEAEYRRAADEFSKDYPTLDLDSEIRRSFHSISAYRDYLRAQLSFDRVFLPNDPADWPAVSVAAMKSDQSGGEVLLDDARLSYETRRKKAGASGGEIEREDPLYVSFLRQIVHDAVYRAITIKTHSDGIASGLALWVDTNGDGRPELECTIEDLWNQVRDRVTQEEIEEAKHWCILTRATRERLERDGAALSPSAHQARMAELQGTLEGTAGGIDGVATGRDRFPSVEHFSQYSDLRMAFESLMAPRLADAADGGISPALADYLPRAEHTIGTAMVDADLLLVAALDIPRFSLKPGGWEQARRSAQTMLAQYERNPTPECWSNLLEEHSEFWDPPPPRPHDGQQRSVCRDILKKGRFGQVLHGSLMFRLQETPYTEWINGECIADRVCFQQEEGRVAGPFRGPFGWYLTRLNRRIPPSQALHVDDTKIRERLKDDYVRWAFIQYSKEAVAQAEVRGWKPL